MTEKLHPETLAAQGVDLTALPHGDIVPAIHVASTFERGGDGSYPGGRVYARDQSPAFDAAEKVLAALEGGAQALLFSSGMAASSAVLQALKPGDRVLAPANCYWAWRNGLKQFAERWKLDLVFYANSDLRDLETKLAAAPAQLLWIETPANPTWEITDIEAATRLGHAAGAMVVVDSTVSTPVLTQPLALGADIVMHSATKYLNGHSDIVAGALITREITPMWQAIRTARNLGGAIPGAFEAWLLQRGLRTLHLRVRAQSASAQILAERLAKHPAVHTVRYPGLASHPGHEIAARQMHGGFGGMISIQVRGGQAAAIAATARLGVFKRATSLGSVESLAEHRASVEGPTTTCPADLIRLSVGVEHVEDLWSDLAQALAVPTPDRNQP